MPIIQFTPGDLLAQELIKDGGWFAAVFTKLEGPTKSKSGSSFNYMGTFTIVDGKYKGKELEIMFNTAMDNGSILGSLQLEPVAKLATIFSVMTGTPIDISGMSVDTDLMVGQPVDININVVTIEGALRNSIIGFAKGGTASVSNKAPF